MSKKSKRRFLYSVRAVLAGGALYFALDLSRGDRGAVDYVVVGLVMAAVAWNLIRLGQRLHEARGGKGLWDEQRTVLFWIIGLLNTVAIRPEEAGTWKNWLGWAILALAVADTVRLTLVEREILAETAADDTETSPSTATD